MSDDKSIRVSWFGQAMFLVEGGGTAVVVDPAPPETGYVYSPVRADVVLVTHSHFDHSYLEGVVGSPVVVDGGGARTVGAIEVRGYDTWHDTAGGEERGPNIAYVWKQGGLKLGHLGDLGHAPRGETLEALRGLDVLMVPVGGVFTIDAAEAAALVEQLKPRVALPMHFGTPDCTIPVRPVDDFKDAYAGKVLEVTERPVEMTAGSLPSGTEVWVLPYK